MWLRRQSKRRSTWPSDLAVKSGHAALLVELAPGLAEAERRGGADGRGVMQPALRGPRVGPRIGREESNELRSPVVGLHASSVIHGCNYGHATLRVGRPSADSRERGRHPRFAGSLRRRCSNSFISVSLMKLWRDLHGVSYA